MPSLAATIHETTITATGILWVRFDGIGELGYQRAMAADGELTGRTGAGTVEARGRGRELYSEDYAIRAYRLALLGKTDVEIAHIFDIAESTLARWIEKKPKFRQYLRNGRDEADGHVAASLYARANGYSHEAVKIFQPREDGGAPLVVPYVQHYPPDTAAASLWLRNRQRGLWREKTDVEVTGALTLEHLILGAVPDRQAEAPAIEGEVVKGADD